MSQHEDEIGKDGLHNKFSGTSRIHMKERPYHWYVDYKGCRPPLDMQEISTDKRSLLPIASSDVQNAVLEESCESSSDGSVGSVDLSSKVATVLEEGPCDWEIDYRENTRPFECRNETNGEIISRDTGKVASVQLSRLAKGYVESIDTSFAIVKDEPRDWNDGCDAESVPAYINRIVPDINGSLVLPGQDTLNSILPDTSVNVYDSNNDSVKSEKYSHPFPNAIKKELNQLDRDPPIVCGTWIAQTQKSFHHVPPFKLANVLSPLITNQCTNVPPSTVNAGVRNNSSGQLRVNKVVINKPRDDFRSQLVEPQLRGSIALVNLMSKVVDTRNKTTIDHLAPITCHATREGRVLNSASESVPLSDVDTNPCLSKGKESNTHDKEMVRLCSTNVPVPDKNGPIFVSGEKVLELLRSSASDNNIFDAKETIVCQICGTFVKRFNLKGHLLMHTRDEIFLCRDCDMVFLKDESFAITLHLLSHRKEIAKRFRLGSNGNQYLKNSNVLCRSLFETTRCDVCGETVSYSTMNEHLLSHSSDHILECNECQTIFLWEEDFRKHLLKHSKKPSAPPTTAIPLHENDVMWVVDKLLDDVEDALAPPPVKRKRIRKKQRSLCDVCGKQFTTLYSLQEHLRIHSNERRHRCGRCGKKFVALTALQNHQRTHTQEKPFKCDDCGKSFRLQSSVYSHRVTHAKDKPYLCVVCKRAFSSQSNLKGHMVTHSDEKPHSCHVCHRAFNHKGALKRHLCYDNRDAEKKLFACKTCGFISVGMNPLKEHYRTVHKGEKKVTCHLCPKKFYNQEQLKNHQLSHKKDRHIACGICSKVFKNSYNLKIHQRIHSGEKPYPCEVCGKCFSQSSSRNSHLLIHKNKKPYVCRICNKSFRQSTSLTKHRRFIHEDDPENSDGCEN